MSRYFTRVLVKAKSPFLRGLRKEKPLFVPTITESAQGGDRQTPGETLHFCIPDVSGGFLPPEAEFLFE